MANEKTLKCDGCGRDVRADPSNIPGLYYLAVHYVASGLAPGVRPERVWCTHARRTQKTNEYVSEVAPTFEQVAVTYHHADARVGVLERRVIQPRGQGSITAAKSAGRRLAGYYREQDLSLGTVTPLGDAPSHALCGVFTPVQIEQGEHLLGGV